MHTVWQMRGGMYRDCNVSASDSMWEMWPATFITSCFRLYTNLKRDSALKTWTGASLWYSNDNKNVLLQLMDCWWNVVSQSTPTVFKSFKWNLLHMIAISITCRYAWHVYFVKPGQRVLELSTFLRNPYVSIFPVTKQEYRVYLSIDSSSLIFNELIELKSLPDR